MSRNDAKRIDDPRADNHNFEQTIWSELLAVIGDVTHITPQIANTVRLRRIEECEADDFLGWFVENSKTSLSEHAVILMARTQALNSMYTFQFLRCSQ